MAMLRSVTIEDQERLIAELWAAWSAHDMERLLALFTEDLLYEDVTMGVINRGAAELRAFGEGFFSGFPDVTFELRSSFANGTGGGAEWTMRGTHKGDLPGCQPRASTWTCAAHPSSNSRATKFAGAPIIGTWRHFFANWASCRPHRLSWLDTLLRTGAPTDSPITCGRRRQPSGSSACSAHT